MAEKRATKQARDEAMLNDCWSMEVFDNEWDDWRTFIGYFPTNGGKEPPKVNEYGLDWSKSLLRLC